MSRKTNRDHAKRQQRPMIEDETISSQIAALLTPALFKQKKYCHQLGLRSANIDPSPDGGGYTNNVVERRSRSQRINKNISA